MLKICLFATAHHAITFLASFDDQLIEAVVWLDLGRGALSGDLRRSIYISAHDVQHFSPVNNYFDTKSLYITFHDSNLLQESFNQHSILNTMRHKRLHIFFYSA